jgi:hypothetical protein
MVTQYVIGESVMTCKKLFFVFVAAVLTYPTLHNACEEGNVAVGQNSVRSCPASPEHPVEMYARGLKSSIATALVVEHQDYNTTFAMTHYDVEHKHENIEKLESLIKSIPQSPDAVATKADLILVVPVKLYQNWFWSWFSSEKTEIPLYQQWQDKIISTVEQAIKSPVNVKIVTYKAGGSEGATFWVRNNPSPNLIATKRIDWHLSSDYAMWLAKENK